MTSINQASLLAKDIQKQKHEIRQLATHKQREAKKFDTNDLQSALLNVFCGFISETVSVVLKNDCRRLICAAYSANEWEIDPLPILTFLHNEGWQTALPRIEKDVSLSFRVWQPSDDLVIGKFDIQEPASESSIVTPDLVIAPLLAFDNYGNRLGRGGGYYDRALKTLRAQGKVLVVGVAFEAQLFDLIPYEEHDEKLDYVLTPSGVRYFEADK